MTSIRRALTVAAATLISGLPLHGQASVPQWRGDFGILSGTLAPPGASIGFTYSSYQASHVLDASGNAHPRDQPFVDVTTALLAYTFPSSVFGGHVAMSATIPWADLVIPTPDAQGLRGWAFSDLYVQPLKIGWTYPLNDVVAGVGVYMPTGRFRAGALDNTGLGMWSSELSLGTTVYLNPTRQGSVSALVSYQSQSTVSGTNQRAGQVLTIEGGVGHTIAPHIGQVGIAYSATWKLTDDQNFPVPSPFEGRNRMYAAGPEVTLPFPLLAAQGSVTFRYLQEFGGRSATEGNTLFVSVSGFAPP